MGARAAVLKDCTGHADKCPRRSGGGLVFRPRKGTSKLTLQSPPALLDQLKTHKKRYTHVATMQMKDASDRMDSALWG
ncbi:hypothetical protein [Nonomuraea dietziae]|uniref:hypothetical protein n=1 Tax=Nonomuraea dietziae TaxID=65515 RepID=UPI00340C55BB